MLTGVWINPKKIVLGIFAFLFVSTLLSIGVAQDEARFTNLRDEQSEELEQVVIDLALAQELELSGEYADLVKLLNSALATRTRILGPKDPLVLKTMNSLASANRKLGNFGNAIQIWRNQLEIEVQAYGPDSNKIASTLNNLSVVLASVGDSDAAFRLMQKAAKLKGPANKTVLNNLAVGYAERGEFSKAIELHEEVLKLHKAIEHEDVIELRSLATTLENLASARIQIGEYERAHEHCKRGVKLLQGLGQYGEQDLPSLLLVYAELHSAEDNHTQAISTLNQGLALSKKSLGLGHSTTSLILHRLAISHFEKGQYKLGFRLLHQSRQSSSLFVQLLLPQLPLKKQDVYLQERYLPTLQAALSRSIQHESDVFPDVARHTLEWLANGKAVAAAAYASRVQQTNSATALVDSSLVEELRSIRSQLAHLSLMLPKSHERDRYLELAVGLDYREQELTEQVLSQGNSIAARPWVTVEQLRKAMPNKGAFVDFARYRDHKYPHQEYYAAWIVRSDTNVVKAVKIGSAKAIDEQISNFRREIIRGSSFADVDDVSQENRDTEKKRLREAKKFPRLLQRAESGDANAAYKVALAYRRGVGSNIDSNKSWLWMKKAAEYGNLYALAEVATKQLNDSDPGNDDKAIEDLWKAQHVAPQAMYCLGVAYLSGQSVEKNKKVAVGHFQQAANLGHEGAIAKLSLLLFDEGLEDRRVLVQAFRQIEARDKLQARKLRSRLLCHLIWSPIEQHLENVEDVTLCPDGMLWLVPWAALECNRSNEPTRFLIESYNFRMVARGRDLIGAANRNATTHPVIFAHPTFSQDSKTKLRTIAAVEPNQLAKNRSVFAGRSRIGRVGPLPATLVEARAIEPRMKLLCDQAPQIYLQDRALEHFAKRLKSPEQILFATHGFFLSESNFESQKANQSKFTEKRNQLFDNPLLRCGLLFSGCNDAVVGTDDGILTGLEITNIDFRGTELVVLSACDTGVGDIRNGEGVAGLRQAFQLAGAQSVLSSLWHVDDAETARLMNLFFDNLAKGKSKSEALRQAQLTRIKARRARHGAAHPFFWAAFTLTGQD